MAVIFIYSNQVGVKSNEFSGAIAREMKQIVGSTPAAHSSAAAKADYNLILRKTTHFVEYLILALLVYRAFKCMGVKSGSSLIFTFLFCLIYAASDELHQSFVHGRSPRALDVCIDTGGALLGLVLAYVTRSFAKGAK